MIIDQTARQKLVQRNQDRKIAEMLNILKVPKADLSKPLQQVQQTTIDSQVKLAEKMAEQLGKFSADTLTGLHTTGDKINSNQDKAMALLLKRMDYQLVFTYQMYKLLTRVLKK